MRDVIGEKLANAEHQKPHIVLMNIAKIDTAVEDCGVKPFAVAELNTRSFGKFLTEQNDKPANEKKPNAIAIAFENINSPRTAMSEIMKTSPEVLRTGRFDKVYLYIGNGY